ncbi:winged helix-turn-helix domain-containing protein [Salinarchaeum sp. IM2453]|uniref:helix-turn-helix transcriptional regulator n=1 Tax=Salinarchaeum sp. IM2453 TaxID=2862870 RepID=UPI001C828B47|nr:helix-turn-helix domain-containing protein [Salinarchaeum sp. IM2453]QZA88911.1 winged helix-turn-helix domain-containing protein [Salinarchaeum sp. IM2453]
MSTQELSQVDTQDQSAEWEDISDLPPSAKLVAKSLQYGGTLTQSQIAERTLLPARTVRYALGRLEDRDIVQSQFSFSDARKRLYTLSVDPPEYQH